jgi:hypothetical protein
MYGGREKKISKELGGHDEEETDQQEEKDQRQG